MTILNVNPPPGMYRNGTPYAAKGRWEDGNLVRWHDGSVRPIGGWERRRDTNDQLVPSLAGDPATETFRDVFAYRLNDGSFNTMFGSNSKLMRLDQGNNVDDITPAGFAGGANEAVGLIGYGVGPYGIDTYGTPRNPSDARAQPVRRWHMDTFGEILLAAYDGGPLYKYAVGDTDAQTVVGAPTEINGMVVTPQRIAMVIDKSASDIRTVAWSDREDFTDWTETVSNFAGSQRLEGAGDLLGLYNVRGEILILSETDAHVARYLGAPFVYGFTSIGTRCQPIAKKSVATTDRFAIWLGERNFWIYDGTLRPLKCDVIDYIFATIDLRQISKMWATTIAAYSEIWWFFQSRNSDDDIDFYVKFDYFEQHWDTGFLKRTGGIDRGVNLSPVMINANGFIWNHEQEAITPNGEVFVQTGPLELKDGNTNMAVRYLFPDVQDAASVSYEFRVRQHSANDDRVIGPYTYNDPVSTTGVLGKEVRLRINGLTNDWEQGSVRLDVQAMGAGFR